MIDQWLKDSIIGLDLCPFARKPFLEGKILVKELSAEDAGEARDNFLIELSSFQSQNKFETALLVYPMWKISFKDFYSFSEDCENYLQRLNLEDEFQIVAFHPEFCFAGLKQNDRANLVNSSPLPLIHILRINDVELLNLSGQDAETMSFANTKRLEALSPEELRKHFPWRF